MVKTLIACLLLVTTTFVVTSTTPHTKKVHGQTRKSAKSVTVTVPPTSQPPSGDSITVVTPVSPVTPVVPAPSPSISITMPAVIEGYVGQFIELEAVTDCAKVNFVPIDRGFYLCPNRQRPLPNATYGCAAVAGTYRVVAYGAKGDQPSDPVVFSVHVTVDASPGPLPGPLPQPNPNPQPQPVVPVPPLPGPLPRPQPLTPLPAGTYGLAEFTRATVLAGVPSAKRTVCASIGENYAVVSAQIAAGTSKTLLDANTKIKNGNHTIIPNADNALWTPVFAALNTKVNSLGLKALTDWQQAFTELGQGFTAAGQVP